VSSGSRRAYVSKNTIIKNLKVLDDLYGVTGTTGIPAGRVGYTIRLTGIRLGSGDRLLADF
jgi:hypothetical protein